MGISGIAILTILVLSAAIKCGHSKKRDGLEFMRLPKDQAKWYLLLNKGGK